MSTPPPATSLKAGIDIGNSKCVIAIARDGIVDALLNEDSKRETPAVIYFSKKHRLFGAAAVASSTINPSSTITQIKRLVACYSNDVDGLSLAYKTSTGGSGEIIVEVNYDGKDYKFNPTEMLAMLLSHLRRTVENSVGNAVAFDCVIGVPSYFSDEQRKAYLNAATIGGWKPIGLLPDGEATAVEYAYYRDDDAPTASVVFVDIGHSDTQITVARFEGRKIELLGRSSDRDLGGRDFDEVLFNFCIEEMKKEKGSNIQLSKKGEARLRAACEKAKKVLSVNREAQISVDSLMGEDYDFRRIITREEFERRSADFFKRIKEKWTEALTDAKINKDEVRFVELVGSGSRIPAISKALTESFGRDLSRTLNGSECIACGCALLCEKIIQPLGLADEKRPKLENDQIYKILMDTEEWIYGDGDDLSEKEYDNRLIELQSMIFPYENLTKEKSQIEGGDNHYEGTAKVDHQNDSISVITPSKVLPNEKYQIKGRDEHFDHKRDSTLAISPSEEHHKEKSKIVFRDNYYEGTTEIDHQKNSTSAISPSEEHHKEKSQIEDRDDHSEITTKIDHQKDSTLAPGNTDSTDLVRTEETDDGVLVTQDSYHPVQLPTENAQAAYSNGRKETGDWVHVTIDITGSDT